MYKKIIVTLDRSAPAEQALAHGVEIAKAFGGRIEVVTVVPVMQQPVLEGTPVPVNWDAEVAQDEEYLKGIAARVKEAGVEVRSEVRRGDVAEEILRHVEEAKADLIVMSTHGRSGLGRWVYGSIADRVLRHSPVPVLLVRATEQ